MYCLGRGVKTSLGTHSQSDTYVKVIDVAWCISKRYVASDVDTGNATLPARVYLKR